MDVAANSLIHYDPKTGIAKSISLDSSGVLGTRNCAAGASSCDVKMIRMDETGIFGIFNPSFEVIEAGTTAPQNTSTHGLRRQLLQSQSSFGEKPISSPIVCLGFGDAMIWDVSHPSRQHFPVYVKDSLLNTNPDFDYTEFRDLSEKIAAPNFTLTTFIYTFGRAGVYTFADNADIFRITVIRVVSENEVCPISPYEPYTQSSLVSMGVVRERDLLLQPDWALIGALIGALVVLVIGTIFALWLFRRQRWGVIGTALPRYREHGIASLNEREFANLASKGSTTKRHQLTASGAERVQPPAGSSRPLTMRLDVHMSEFDADFFCSTIAQEVAVDEGNVLVLTTTDEGKIVVRFVFTGIDYPDAVADRLIDRILEEGNQQSDLHSHLNILGFEDSAAEPSANNAEQQFAGGDALNIAEMEDEFWDYERQIDLEGFNIRTLYSRLEDQTIHVVAQLAHQRDDLMLLCDKILVESEALKDMFLRIKVDMDDKNQQERRINDIREEKIVSGQVEYDLPEDVKQVLGQFLESFFDKNLPSIIQNANIQTTNVENRTVNVIHQGAQEYETVVREANDDGTFNTRVEKGKDAYDAARRRTITRAPTRATPRSSVVVDANALDGFKDMFSTTISVSKGDVRLKRASDQQLTPEELSERQLRVRKMTRYLPRHMHDDSDCDDEERAERAANRERALLKRASRFRRAIDRVTMPGEFVIDTPSTLSAVLSSHELESLDAQKREWQEQRRRERLTADTFPEELLDDATLSAGERSRRQMERERLLAKRVARMEDVLRFFELPESLEGVSGADSAEAAALRARRERFMGQKMEKARRVRAELSVPMSLDDDSDADDSDRVRLQDAREELVTDLLLNNQRVSLLPDPNAATNAEDAENRWIAIDNANAIKIAFAQETIQSRDLPDGQSDHSDLDAEENARRRRARNAAASPKITGGAKPSQRAPICAPVQIDDFTPSAGDCPQQYEDDSDLEDSDRVARSALRVAFAEGRSSALPVGVIPKELEDDGTVQTAEEKARRHKLREAFAKGQNARETVAILRTCISKAKDSAVEAQEILESGDTEIVNQFENGRQKERELLSPEFQGSDADRKRQANAYHTGRLAQRMLQLPEEMDEGRHNVSGDRKRAMKIRAEAFSEGADDAFVSIPEEMLERPDMTEPERAAVSRAREAFAMGRSRGVGDLLAKEIEAMRHVDADMADAMRAAQESGIAAANNSSREVPVELRDDIPLLSDGEAARRRRLQAVYIQAMKAQQAARGYDQLVEDPSLSPQERKSLTAAYTRALNAQRDSSKMPSHVEESHEAFSAFIQGAHQRRAADLIQEDLKQSVHFGKQLSDALHQGLAAQKRVADLPEELVDSPDLSAVERAERASRRDAFITGRRARQAQSLPEELPDEEPTRQIRGAVTASSAAPASISSSRAAVGQARAPIAAETGGPVALEEVAEEAAKLKQHKQQLLKRARERQKDDFAQLAEETEVRADADVAAIASVLDKQFRHEINELKVRQGIALSKCAPEEMEEMKEAHAAELTAVANSQAVAMHAAEEDVRAVAESTREKMEEVIAAKHINDARVEASLAEQRAKAARKMNTATAKKPSELETVEELKEYTKYLSDDLKQRDRLQAAKVAKEKALLAEQLQLVEKIEFEGLESRVSKTKARAMERARHLLAGAPPQELEEEISRIEKTFAMELDAEKAALKNRLTAEKIAKTQQLADAHVAEAELVEAEARRETDELVAASRVLKERAVKAEQELTDEQKRAVDMLMAQERIKEEFAQQRKVAAEEAEVRAVKARAEEKVRSDAAREIARRERENGEKMTDAQRQAILEEYRRDAAKFDAASSSEEQRQAEARNQRLAQQRAKRERDSNLKNLQAMNAETQRQLEEQQRRAAALAAEVPVSAAKDEGAAEGEEVRLKLEAELAEKAAALKRRHEDQKQQLERQLEEEVRKHEEREAARMAAEAERKKQALVEEHQRQLSQATTDEQRNELLKSHAAEASRVEDVWAADAAAQLAKLEARREAHRKKKLAELADRQRAQNADREDESDAARVEMGREMAREGEQRRIEEAVRKGANRQHAAEVVLADRHQREIQQTMERHANRRKDFSDEQQAHLETLAEAKRSVDASAEVEIRGIPEDHPDRERKVEDIRKKQKKALDRLVEENTERDETRSDAMEMLIAEELLALKMRQMNEVFEAAGVKSTDAIARYKAKLSSSSDASAEEDELVALKRQREEQNAAAQEKLKKEKEARDAAMKAEFDEMKRRQEEDFAKQKEAMEEQARQDEERLRQKLNAHKAALAREGKSTTVAAEELEALSKNITSAHAQSVALMEERSRQNQQSQLESYASRLEKRRAGRAHPPTGAAASSSKPAPPQAAIAEGIRKLTQLSQPLPSTSIQQQAAGQPAASQDTVTNVTNINNFVIQQQQQQQQQRVGDGASNQQPVLGMPAPGSAEYQQWIFGVVQQMCSSPLMIRLERIERMVEATYNQSGLLSYFLDEKDRAFPANEGRLEVIDVARLSTAQYVVYGFATWVLESVQKMGLGVPDVKIAVASQLPDVQSGTIAFRNSYHYDTSRRTLYVRDSRLNTIGEFTVVVLHAVAHIMASATSERSGVMTWNDADPAFLTHFYGLLEVCTEEMFFMRLPKELASRDETARTAFRPSSIMSARSLAAIGDSLKGAGETADGRHAMLKNSLMLE